MCRCPNNRSGVRLLMSCLLAKLDMPRVDPRKPYTEIGDEDAFSGRTYDERYLTYFIVENRLPANATTAYLTPTLRNIDYPLTSDRELVGRPRELYSNALQLLADVADGDVAAGDLLAEFVRMLMLMREERESEIARMVKGRSSGEATPISSEGIVTLIGQHLACPHSSRLPVLVVAAAYTAAGEQLRERILPLNAHNAADTQTGSVGDVEICVIGENSIVTAYEMKMKRVTRDDIDTAVTKIASSPSEIDNYLFVSTEEISLDVVDYAKRFYRQLGTEIAILDCLSFLKHFLHLFSRVRGSYLDAYQELVLSEPDSALNHDLKTAFLALRRAAEAEP